ncbi:MAG TPA: TrmH family RNA methyltransferase, partial [Lentimicrobium sp.]|nr:TrmH family RNA methyltransferase [Lentimicrobium sp.]
SRSQNTARGATAAVKWEHFASTMEAIQALKAQNFTVISIEQAEGSVSLDDFNPDLQKKYALIYGNEVHGVDDDVIDSSDYCLEIPQEGTKHSLNVSVAAGIVLWTFYRKLKDIKL